MDMFKPTRKSVSWLLPLAAAALLGGCAREAVKEGPVQRSTIADVPDSAWTALAARRVYFGHQSVGENVMDGVADVLAAEPRLGLRVVTDEAAPDAGGAFLHGPVGRNGDPGGKTDDFAARLDGPLAGKVDVAFHKYCYVDVTAASDVPALFERYRTAMARLAAAHPGVVFVHVTTPLVTVPGGAAATVKRLLGRVPGRAADDLARERFNELMRKEYAGREPVFDLAAVESTRPDGTREVLDVGGERAYALVPAYASDGSHLNETGRRRAAEELLVFLARLPASR
jgi:hypothetical protein